MRHAVRHNTSSLLALKGAYRIVKDQKTQHPANPIGISFAVHPATIFCSLRPGVLRNPARGRANNNIGKVLSESQETKIEKNPPILPFLISLVFGRFFAISIHVPVKEKGKPL
jgi:hypothetical protein